MYKLRRWFWLNNFSETYSLIFERPGYAGSFFCFKQLVYQIGIIKKDYLVNSISLIPKPEVVTKTSNFFGLFVSWYAALPYTELTNGIL